MPADTAVQRARKIQADLKAECSKIERDLARAVLTPDHDERFPHRKRNGLADEALLALEQKQLLIHRLERLIPEVIGSDTEGHIALDRFTGEQTVPEQDAVNPAKVNRLVRELNAPTNPYHSDYVEDHEFTQNFNATRERLYRALDMQANASPGEQREAAKEGWAELGLADDLQGDRWDSDDAVKNRQALELMLGSLPRGHRPVDTFTDADPRDTGDAELNAALREQFPLKG